MEQHKLVGNIRGHSEMSKKLFSGILTKVIVGILAILCLTALADKHRQESNPFFSHERLIIILSEENITARDQILHNDTAISITPALSDILDVQNWTKVDTITQEEGAPILSIEYTDFQFIHIYGNYARLEDNSRFLPYKSVYYQFPHDISQALLAYLDACQVAAS